MVAVLVVALVVAVVAAGSQQPRARLKKLEKFLQRNVIGAE